jgi:regulator of cell morphogenesis and NO signaling
MNPARTTVAELIKQQPQRAKVLERLGIACQCTASNISLDEACRRRGLDGATVLQVLIACEHETSEEQSFDWESASLREMCDHIVATHHDYLRREIPRLGQMIEDVAAIYAQNHPHLAQVRHVFAEFAAELQTHMTSEEKSLFPAIIQMEAGLGPDGSMHCGNIERPVFVMISEHEDSHTELAHIRELTNDYTVPAGVGDDYCMMLRALAELEADMKRHVEEETRVLFPRALESRAAKTSSRR